MNYGIAFTPLVPSLVLWLALAAIAVIAALLLLGRSRGAAVRLAALALIVLAQPILAVLFQRGAFGPVQTAATASS